MILKRKNKLPLERNVNEKRIIIQFEFSYFRFLKPESAFIHSLLIYLTYILFIKIIVSLF